MIKRKTAFSLAAAGLCLVGISAPAQAATGDAAGRARIHNPMTLAALLDLNFGSIVSDGTEADVVLNVDTSTRDCPAGVTTCVGGYAFATLHITGDPANLIVTYNPNIQLTGPGQPMDVTILFPGGSGATIVSDGDETIEFGASLHINAGQAEGDYSATFSVDVNYP